MKKVIFSAALILSIPSVAFSAPPSDGEEFPKRIQGDLGGAVYTNSSIIKGHNNHLITLPYAYFDYGRLFARLDTFGVKTLPLGYGYLEIVHRISFDGYRTNTPTLRGINDRKRSIPFGIGTFQQTPIGAFFLNAFYDANQSHGSLYEAIYAAEFDFGNTVVYPQMGIEHYSKKYTQYFYGVSSAEAAASIFPAYIPAASTNLLLGFVLEVRLQGNWYTNLYMRRRWLGTAISNSPLVDSKYQDTAFISINYRYH